MYKFSKLFGFDNSYTQQQQLYIHLASNTHPEALNYLEKCIKDFNVYNKYEIWYKISKNSNAINILNNNPDLIDTGGLCVNTNPLILNILYEPKYFSNIVWSSLSCNSSDGAVKILLENIDKIDWRTVCYNTNTKIVELILKKLENNNKTIQLDKIQLDKIQLDKIQLDKIQLDKIQPDKIQLDKIQLDKIQPDKINWKILSKNTNKLVMDFIYNNFYIYYNELDFCNLSENINAIKILSKHPEIIEWDYLVNNINAYELIKNNMDNIQPEGLLYNQNIKIVKLVDLNNILDNEFKSHILSKNPVAINILKKNRHIIRWDLLDINNESIKLLKELKEFKKMHENNTDLFYYTGTHNRKTLNWTKILKSPYIFECDYIEMRKKLWIYTDIAKELFENRFNIKYMNNWKDWGH